MHSDWKKRVIDRFDEKTDSYSEHSDLQARVAKSLSSHLPKLSNAEILEIGCGSGLFTQYLINHYPDAQLHITDISPNMIKVAQKNVRASERVQWSVMDGEAVGSSHKYDLIVSNMTFQWFADPERSLSKLCNLLKPEGRLLFTVPSNRSFKEWKSVLSALSLSHSSMPHYEWPNIFHEEEMMIDYGTTLNFLRHFKMTGADVPSRGYNMLSVSDFKRACSLTDQKYNGHITWNILFGCVLSS